MLNEDMRMIAELEKVIKTIHCEADLDQKTTVFSKQKRFVTAFSSYEAV